MSSLGARAALVVGTVAAATVGWVGARRHFDGEDSGGHRAGGSVNLYECPMAGALSIGQVRAGDPVELIGVTGGRWAVIRMPGQPDRPAWMPLALLDTPADAVDVPEVGCADAVDLAGGAPTITTAAPTDDGTGTSVLATTTTLPSGSTTTSTTTTLAVDTTPPTVTMTADHTALVAGDTGECGSLKVTVVIDDPSKPLYLVGVQASWTGKGGVHEVTLDRVGPTGYHYTLTVPSAQGPSGSQADLTITATARDGRGNVGTGTLVLPLTNSGGC